MIDYKTIGEQILTGVVLTLWLLSRPLVWVYSLLSWFIVSTTKETGRRLVKLTASTIALFIFGFAVQFFT